MINDITHLIEGIHDVVNVDELQDIQEKFAVSMGLGAIITDNDGRPVTYASFNSRFCQMIRSCPKGNARCEQSDSDVTMKSFLKGRQVSHRCHAGLVDAAAPIVFNGQPMGSILCGQILFDEQERYDKEALRARIGDLTIDFEEAYAEYQKMRVMSEEQFNKDAAILALMANYITEMGVKALIEKQYTAQKNKLRDMELKLLENQLNPHFLFNTLNTITGLAITERAENTQMITFALADLLRNNIKSSGKLVTVREELRQVRNYLVIQQTRFGERLKVNWDVEPSTDEFFIPILTIQTLVENAIVHGMEPREEQTELLIRTYMENDQAVIEIVDNGCGINSATVFDIMEMGKTGMVDSKSLPGLGMHHVLARLQYYFGSNYGFSVQSELGQGTRVTVKIPRFENNR